MPTIVWLALFVILAVAEFLTLALTTIWFAGGALVAFIASLLGANIVVQIILFTVVSLILLISTRPWAVKYINKGTIKTNSESLVGNHVKVVEPVSNINNTGVVIVNGLEWTARTEHDGIVIPINTIVTIVRLEGVKLIVRPTLKEEV